MRVLRSQIPQVDDEWQDLLSSVAAAQTFYFSEWVLEETVVDVHPVLQKNRVKKHTNPCELPEDISSSQVLATAKPHGQGWNLEAE